MTDLPNRKFVEVTGLTQRFDAPGEADGQLTVYENVNFEIAKGEFVCIIGHSGCGKSTILSTLAGLNEGTEGGIVMNGKEVRGPSLERGVVFQNYSLYPWLSARKNVMFGVQARFRTWSKAQVRAHSEKFLSLVGLDAALDRKPSQLSGGMRQRVSIARAFATQPSLLLLDEPFGALDALTRGTIQDELLKIWSETRQTVFMITHDVDEAILLADRIFLMSNGPDARVAEAVEIAIPRPRNRTEILKDPGYYTIRNYLMNFLHNEARRPAKLVGGGHPKPVNPVELAGGGATSRAESFRA